MRALILRATGPIPGHARGWSRPSPVQAAALGARQKLEVHTEFCEEPILSFEAKEALYRIAPGIAEQHRSSTLRPRGSRLGWP